MAHSFARSAAAAALLRLLACAGAYTGLVGCAETSPSGVVVAPVASGPSVSTPAALAPALDGDAAADGATDTPDANAPAPGSGAEASSPVQFRACAADADCVAVPRVGCCHNGWNEAVTTSQRAAYAASFTCPNAHPVCPMFFVRDTRAARCDAQSRLCTMVPSGAVLPP
jgi:hypothetical protein